MKKGVTWLILSGLMMLSLVLVSCAPKVTEEKKVVTEEKAVTKKEEAVKQEAVVKKEEVVTKKEMVADALGRLVPKPQYGGVLTSSYTSDVTYLSEFTRQGPAGTYRITNLVGNELVSWDRLKGPGTSNPAWSGYISINLALDDLVGHLAESWEIREPDTFIVHIRKGVYWQNKPPANGRQMTAGDVVWTMRQNWGATDLYWQRDSPYLKDMKNLENSIYLDPNDPWTVVVKTVPGMLGAIWEIASDTMMVVAEGYKVTRWQDIMGTGPFILTDYVAGSSYTYERNPKYWQKDQLHPENQLPYVDVYKELVIPDPSTAMAALRTGKIDQLAGLEGEDVQSLKSTNPELRSLRMFPRPNTVALREDVKPFNDVRVRQAMMMAIDQPTILRDFLGGDGELFYGLALPVAEHSGFWVPLKEMPEVVQKMFGYYPEEAKRLLDEAGYPGPNRFTFSVVTNSAEDLQSDMGAILKNYWAKVGITMNIDVKEAAVFNAMINAKTYEQAIWDTASPNDPFKWIKYTVGNVYNRAMLNDPVATKAYQDVQTNLFNKAVVNRIVKEAFPKIAAQAHYQYPTHPYEYSMWQPWVMSYHGETNSNKGGTNGWIRYAWVDQDLKEKMTGRR
ncbi:MAG: ABC transporter substrate-binding protein [Chloroflexi bacterium]|nr:ABC transporter substrate-binding protein [Chloroflexota bacterium]